MGSDTLGTATAAAGGAVATAGTQNLKIEGYQFSMDYMGFDIYQHLAKLDMSYTRNTSPFANNLEHTMRASIEVAYSQYLMVGVAAASDEDWASIAHQSSWHILFLGKGMLDS